MLCVAFVAAMGLEARTFLHRVGAARRDSVGGFSIHRFELCGHSCILLKTGVGMAHGAAATRALLSAERPAFVISFGIAGAPTSGLEVGDVVAAESVRRLKNGQLGPAYSLGRFPDPAFKAVEEVLKPMGTHLSRGTLITTWAEQAPAPELNEQGPIVIDMETAGIAEACREADVALYSLRAVSDSVSEPLPFNLEDFVDDQQQLAIGRLAAAVLRRPCLLPLLLSLTRNARRAAAIAAVAALGAASGKLQIK